MSSIGERLREIRKQKGLSQAEFGELAGVTKRSQMLYENEQRLPKADYLMSLDDMGVDVGYVLTGRHGAEAGDDAQGLPSLSREVNGGQGPAALGSSTADPEMAAIKLYDVECAAGSGRSLEEERVEGVLSFPQAQLSALGLSAERVAGVKVRGDSMESTLADGDWVLVNLADTDYRQEGVFLLLVSGERRIKRVQRLAGGALYLISDNEHYRPEMIPPERMREVEILGRCEVRIGRIA